MVIQIHMAEGENERTSCICPSLPEHRVDTCHCDSKLSGWKYANCHVCLPGAGKCSPCAWRRERGGRGTAYHVSSVLCPYADDRRLIAKVTPCSHSPLLCLFFLFSFFPHWITSSVSLKICFPRFIFQPYALFLSTIILGDLRTTHHGLV